MLSRTTNKKKHWHHTEDKYCNNCNNYAVFIVDHKENNKNECICTECNFVYITN